MAAGKATLQGWLVASVHNGEKATAEDIEEIRYATEFTPTTAEIHLADKNANANGNPDPLKSIASRWPRPSTRATWA